MRGGGGEGENVTGKYPHAAGALLAQNAVLQQARGGGSGPAPGRGDAGGGDVAGGVGVEEEGDAGGSWCGGWSVVREGVWGGGWRAEGLLFWEQLGGLGVGGVLERDGETHGSATRGATAPWLSPTGCAAPGSSG